MFSWWKHVEQLGGGGKGGFDEGKHEVQPHSQTFVIEKGEKYKGVLLASQDPQSAITITHIWIHTTATLYSYLVL